jgi:polysaccharide export outer membrane protein
MSIKNVGKGLRRWITVCGLVLGGLCLAGCRTQSPEQQFAEVPTGVTTGSGAATITSTPAPATPASAPATAPVAAQAANPVTAPAATNSGGPEPEVFRVGDSLTIVYSDLPGGVTPPFEGKIKEDGTITLLLNQTFKADGKSPGMLEKEIRACYVPKYYKYMTVTVKQIENTRWYYVDGEVKSPNRWLYTSRITVLKAIASAGGFTDFANRKSVRLTRVDGRTQTVNCVKALDDSKLDLEVYPGDKIYIRRKIW